MTLTIKQQFTKYNHNSGGNKIVYIVEHFTGNKGDTAQNNADYFGRADRGASAHYFVDDVQIVQIVRDGDKAWHCGDGRGKYGISNSNSVSIEMCGDKNGNISAKTRANALELTRMLMKKYNVPTSKVVRHYDASRKCCPEPWSKNNWAEWWAFKKDLENGTNNSKPVITPSKPTPAPSKTPLWELCISGQLVKDLQSELNKQYGAGLKVDGYFGEGTLNKCPLVRQGARGNITKIIQKRLLQRGYTSLNAHGGADGSFGAGTTTAVKNLQRNKGLSVDGIVGKDTWKQLFLK